MSHARDNKKPVPKRGAHSPMLDHYLQSPPTITEIFAMSDLTKAGHRPSSPALGLTGKPCGSGEGSTAQAKGNQPGREQ
ncbi:hypothetical protein LIA77_09027 [Sarocladium implicatum]|nr:hypothetical protein LIA77_09027 [Sarocladium implicatum]